MSDYPFQPVEEALAEFLPTFDTQVIEILMAVVVANWANGPPVWLELIAPSSLGKTMILEPLEEVKGARILSKLSPNTLLSGSKMAGDQDPSLLNRIGKRPFIVIKELSSLLEGDPRARSDIFAQLREVWDGHIVRAYGTGFTREWRGKATVIAGITPHVDTYWSFDAHLGERFLKLRYTTQMSPEDLAMKAWGTTGEETTMNDALNIAYKECVEAGIENLHNVSLSTTTARQLAALSAFTACARTPVARDSYRRDEILLPPSAEGTPRLMKSFALVAQGLAAIRGTTDISDLDPIFRIAQDCMPEPRRGVFLKILDFHTQDVQPTAQELNGVVSGNHIYRVLEDLELAGAITSNATPTNKPGRPAKKYKPSNNIVGYLDRFC